MTIERTQNGNCYTLGLNGWLDTQAAPELEKELAEIPEGAEELVFDCEKLEYISSSGVRQLVAAHKKMNGNFKLMNVSMEIEDVLNMTGVAERITII